MPDSAPRRRSKKSRDGGTDLFAATAGLTTVGEWLTWANKLYRQHKPALGQVTAIAQDEALYLLLHALGLPLESDAHVLDRRLTTRQREAVKNVFRRRILERIPAAYITCEAFLGEHRFYVDERVIIPRSYFLELIPQELDRHLPAGQVVRRVVDVCTGSGCLAILLAHHYRAARVEACDLSADALDVARINVQEHRLKSRVHLFQSDVFDAVPPARYDLILSNPPYEPSARVAAQAPEFAAEPRLAHDGGRDGLAIIRKLLAQAPTRLAPHGILVVEVGGLRSAVDREFAAFRPEWLRTQDGSDCVALFRAARIGAAATIRR